MYPTATKNPRTQPWNSNGSSMNGYPNQPPPPYAASQSWNPQQGTPQGTTNSMSAPASRPGTIPPQKGAPAPTQQLSSTRVTEVKLFSNNREREMYDNMADLFSIIKTIEALEKAYVRDAVTPEDYKKNCLKLIAQFKAAQNLTRDIVPDIKKFMQDYRIDNCKAAWKRIEEGFQPDVLPKADVPNTARVVAETVQFFITAMDSLKLNMTAVDQIHPLLTDLLESLCKIASLPNEWEGKIKIKNWLVQLNKMKASDELNEEQIRQMLFDLEGSYNAFHRSLSSS